MNARYSNTERLGVIEADRIFTKEIGWIFREQSLLDFGIDAIIEEVSNGNPTGKLIAAQIKSGKCNFLLTNDIIIYYISQIHYDYWLNSNIPIILIAHLPENNKTYWQEIKRSYIKKTRKRWKIEIPIHQELNIKSKNRISRIIEDRFLKMDYDNECVECINEDKTVFDYIENINCISESTSCIDRCSVIINEFSEKMNKYHIDLVESKNNHLSINDNEVKANLKGVARLFNVSSKKIESEILMFSKLFSDGMYAYAQVIKNAHKLLGDNYDIKSYISIIEAMPYAIDISLPSFQSFKNNISKFGKYKYLMGASIDFVETLDFVISEYSVAKEIAEEIILELNNEHNKTC